MVFFYKNKHVQLFLSVERFKTARNMQFKFKVKHTNWKQKVREFFKKDVLYIASAHYIVNTWSVSI